MIKKTLLSLLISTSVLIAVPVYADFTDEMSTTDPNTWRWWAAQGWSNGYPFDTCWKSSQFSRNQGIGTFNLAKSTACAESTIGPEYRTNGYYGYGTYSFTMKAPAATTGVVMGAFLYRGPYDNNNGNLMHNEIDIEFIKGRVQFNYYHNDVGGHEFFLSPQALGFKPQDGYHVYSFSWQANTIKFLVDNVVKYTGTIDVPTTGEGNMKIMMNLWKCLDSAWCGSAPTNPNTTGYVDRVSYTAF